MFNTFQKFKKGKKFQKISFKRVKSFRSFNYCNWLPFCNFCIVTLLTFVTFVTIYTFGTSVVFAGIANTKHDLSATSTGATIKAVSETQKCVFCHTPHHSSTKGPLWNRNLSTATYIVPSKAEWPSLLSVPGQPDRGAKLCLSCHDGTVAIGSVLNMPGAGMAGTIAMSGVTAEGKMPCSPTDYTCLGIDISGHHPVSIAYNNNLYNDKTTQCNNCQSAMPIKSPASVTSPVKLRPTDNTYGGAGGLGVQCSSCHDPHNNSYGKFLVMAYDGSNLCYACHYDCTATCQ